VNELAVTFRNRIALFLRGFAAVWLCMLAAMTYVLVRHGAPEGSSKPMVVLVMALFWIAGIGLSVFVSGKPCFYIDVSTIGSEPIDLAEGHNRLCL
jgi:hypothetical protein